MARTTNTERARTRLERQASGIFDEVPQIASPQPANYGVYNNAYAAAQQARALDPYFGGANTLALGLHAIGEDRAYAEELEATRQAQLKAQNAAAYYGFLDKTMRDAGDVPIGTYSVFQDPTTGRAGVNTDPVFAAAENAMAFDERAADSQGTRAGAIKSLAESGFAPTPADVSQFMRNPLESAEGAVPYGVYETPSVQVDRYGTDQGLTYEQQLELERVKGAYAAMGRGDPNAVEWKQEINPYTGVVEWVAKGTNAAFDTYGLSPPGSSPRPNAGAQAPGASATQGSVNPVENAKAIALQLFPGIQVTQNRRDPNSALGRANPDSWHNRSGAALDTKAIPGMTFNQYVQRYRDAGYDIIEAIDEYKNPSPHATGKHWHVVLGQRRQQPARQAQAQGEPPVRMSRISSIMRRAQERGGTVEQVGDKIVITAPDGRKRTYDANGNVVGG